MIFEKFKIKNAYSVNSRCFELFFFFHLLEKARANQNLISIAKLN